MSFGIKLKELRVSHQLTQKELGELLGKTGATICDWETGKARPDIGELSRLADIFQVTTDYLLGRLTPYSPFTEFVRDYFSHRERTLNVTIFKKFNQNNLGLLDRLLVYLAAHSDSNDLFSELFSSTGYRIDLIPEYMNEWETPQYELPEQKKLRLEKEKQEALHKKIRRR